MGLREALELVPDHRSSQERRHSLGAILNLAVGAMLCGARSLYAIAQWGRDQGSPITHPLRVRPWEDSMRRHPASDVQGPGCGGL